MVKLLKKELLHIFIPSLKVDEEKILRTLIKSKRKLTTSQIQEHTGFSWTTCKKSLDNLEKENKVKKEHLKTIIYWYIE